MEKQGGHHSISQVAKAAGVSPQTLRVWERRGLLHPERTPGGQRRYSETDLAQAERISRLRRRDGWNPAAIMSSNLIDTPVAESDSWRHLALGMRIRSERRRCKMTIAEVAEKVGISASYLSSLERGESGVTLRTLALLADLFNVPQSRFSTPTPRGPSMVRPGERAQATLDDGVRVEELAPPGHTLEPALLIVSPGGSSGGPVHRAAEIFVLVLSGRLVFELHDSDEAMDLGPGDSLVVSAGATWSWRNDQRRDARVVWVEQLPPDAWREILEIPESRSRGRR